MQVERTLCGAQGNYFFDFLVLYVKLVANELVTPWYVPQSQAKRVERFANS